MATTTDKNSPPPSALPIRIQSLTKKYGSMYALDDVDLEVFSGEFLTLLGPSGSGKTTLLMAIAGFNRPDSGSIRFGDTEMILTPPHKRDVGMVFQSYALFPHMTVAENIGFPLKLRKVNSAETAERVTEALATVQLTGLGDRKIDQLSGGQRQRVALARAFVFRPRILLMDEPLSALDKKLREQMQIELKQLHRQLGVTTVYVTHDQREALTMSDRIAIINHGKLAQVDTPQAIYNRPSNSFVADFIGESTILPLTLDTQERLLFEEQLVLDHLPEAFSKDNSRDWSLVVRPERISLNADSQRSENDCLVFRGEVKEFVYQGETALALVKVGKDYDISVRLGTNAASSQTMMKPGDEVNLSLSRDDVIVIPQEKTP